MEIPKNFSPQIANVRKTLITPSIPKNYLFGSLAFCLLALAVYLILAGYVKLAGSLIKNLDQEIQDTVASLSVEEVERVLVLDVQLKGLRKLLPQHVFVSEIFSVLENNTSPQVSFSSFKLDTARQVLYLEGLAPTLTEVSIQAAALKDQPYIRDVVLKDARQDAAGFTFRIEVYFANDLIIAK
jgi:hypothetical protein